MRCQLLCVALLAAACLVVAVSAKSAAHHNNKHTENTPAAHHSSTHHVNGATKPRLAFNANGKFRVMQWTDTHYGMEDNAAVDAQTLNITKILLAAETPDLVIFTGDTVMNTGHNCTENWFREHWATLVSPLQEAGIPWAWVSGNHDDEYCSDYPREWIAHMDMEYDLSVTYYTEGITGVNYVLPIHTSASSSAVSLNLWMLDSGSYTCETVSGYGCVMQDQIQWYQTAARAAAAKNGGVTVPAAAFMHIPTQEYMMLYNAQNVTGSFWQDPVSCQAVNTGLFSAFKVTGDVQLVTVGHDHNNDWGADYKGVHLQYGRKTGYGCYGPPAGHKSGARVFEFTNTPFSIASWVREDDGGRVEPSDIHQPSTSDFLQSCCCS